MSFIERLATLRRSNFRPLFADLCDFDSSLYIYCRLGCRHMVILLLAGRSSGVLADAFAASCAPLSRCLPPQQPEELWFACLHTHPRAGKSLKKVCICVAFLLVPTTRQPHSRAPASTSPVNLVNSLRRALCISHRWPERIFY